MATYNIDRINFQGDTYLLHDASGSGGSGSGGSSNLDAGTGLEIYYGEEGGETLSTPVINHTNSITSQPVQGLYPITYDSEGHIDSAGVAITNISYFTNDVGYLTNASVPEGASAYDGTISAIGATQAHGSNPGFARGDHVHNLTITLNNQNYTPTNGVINLGAETDPTVPAWAKASTKPTYTASEVGALPNNTVIPTKISDLTNDSEFITRITLNNVTYSPTNGTVDLGIISGGSSGGTPTSFGITYDSDNDTIDGAGQAIINFITGDGLDYNVTNALTSKLSVARWGIGSTISSNTLTVPANGIYLLLGGKYNNRNSADYAGAWILSLYNGISAKTPILTPVSDPPTIDVSGLSVTLTPGTPNYYFTLIGVHA